MGLQFQLCLLLTKRIFFLKYREFYFAPVSKDTDISECMQKTDLNKLVYINSRR